MEAAAEALRNHPGDPIFNPANPFKEHIGGFWGILSTRPFMISKGHVIDAYRRIRTIEAVTKAYDECKDVLRHNRKDNMGMQEAAAPLMVRLGKDQEAYDYIKWWDTAYTKPDYDWNDMTLPYLNIHNADVFEPLTAFGMDDDCECECVPNTGLSHLVTLMLIKLRLTLDLTECGRFITSTSPAE